MPKEKVKWIEYLLEKHGEDYEVIGDLIQLKKGCGCKCLFLFQLGHGQGQKQPLSRNCSPDKTENQAVQEKACLLGQIHESVWKTTTFHRNCERVIFEHVFNKLWTFLYICF